MMHMGARVFFLAVALLSLDTRASAQKVEFDVVSVKPNKSNSDESGTSGHKGLWRATNVTVKNLIQNAYQVLPDQIVGAPAWIDSDRFDIEGKYEEDPATSPAESAKRHKLRLQALLAGRFQFQIHRETKEWPSYILVVGKKGPKLTPSEANYSLRGGPGRLQCKAVTMDSLAGNLALRLRRPVVNQTGLAGKFDFTLDFEPEGTAISGAEATKPSLFTAVQDQLGLKLEPAKTPVELLVVDHVERPSAN
jgi:uncharacterized protein (TIGR03435 family)